MFLLSVFKQILSCYSLQLQQLQDVPSHQADHVGPMTEDTIDQFILINVKHTFMDIFYHITLKMNVKARKLSRIPALTLAINLPWVRGHRSHQVHQPHPDRNRDQKKMKLLGNSMETTVTNILMCDPTLAPAAPSSPLAPSRPG